MEKKGFVTKVYCLKDRKVLRIPAYLFRTFFVGERIYLKHASNSVEFSVYPSAEFRKARRVYRYLVALPPSCKVVKNNKVFWSLKRGKLIAEVYNFSGNVGKKAFEVIIHL